MRTQYRVPAVYVLALFIADAGAAVPFGLAGGGGTANLTAIEWVLSAVFAVSAIALLLRLAGVLRKYAEEAMALSAGAWAAFSIYVGLLSPEFTWRDRLGMALMFAGYAVATAYAYALEHVAEHRK